MSIDNFLRNGLAKRIFSENEVIFLSTIDGTRFGLIPFKLVPLLERFPKIFIVKKDQNLIEIVGDNFDSRSAAAFAFSARLKENFEEIAFYVDLLEQSLIINRYFSSSKMRQMTKLVLK
jgi:hypothetical protein